MWAPTVKWVNGVNVTSRYTKKQLANGMTRLMVKVVDTDGRTRVAKNVTVNNGEVELKGTSRNETFDTNDFLTFDVPQQKTYTVRIGKDATLEKDVKVGDRKQVIVEFTLKK